MKLAPLLVRPPTVTVTAPVVAPAGTPKAVIARVNRDINAALAEPELVERISAIGPIVDPGKSPEQVADFLRQEHQRWSEIAKEIGLLPE